MDACGGVLILMMKMNTSLTYKRLQLTIGNPKDARTRKSKPKLKPIDCDKVY
jgi:hypothetical protein